MVLNRRSLEENDDRFREVWLPLYCFEIVVRFHKHEYGNIGKIKQMFETTNNEG